MVCCEVVDVVVPEGLRTLRLEMRRRRSLSGACQSSPPFLGYRRASARDTKVNDQPFKMAKNDPYKSASRPSGRLQVMTKKLYIGVPRKEEKSMAMRGLGLRGLICRSCCPFKGTDFSYCVSERESRDKRRYDVDAITSKVCSESERSDRKITDKNLSTEKGRSPELSGVPNCGFSLFLRLSGIEVFRASWIHGKIRMLNFANVRSMKSLYMRSP
jgi:hypothetical protein